MHTIPVISKRIPLHSSPFAAVWPVQTKSGVGHSLALPTQELCRDWFELDKRAKNELEQYRLIAECSTSFTYKRKKYFIPGQQFMVSGTIATSVIIDPAIAAKVGESRRIAANMTGLQHYWLTCTSLLTKEMRSPTMQQVIKPTSKSEIIVADIRGPDTDILASTPIHFVFERPAHGSQPILQPKFELPSYRVSGSKLEVACYVSKRSVGDSDLIADGEFDEEVKGSFFIDKLFWLHETFDVSKLHIQCEAYIHSASDATINSTTVTFSNTPGQKIGLSIEGIEQWVRVSTPRVLRLKPARVRKSLLGASNYTVSYVVRVAYKGFNLRVFTGSFLVDQDK